MDGDIVYSVLRYSFKTKGWKLNGQIAKNKNEIVNSEITFDSKKNIPDK